MSFTGSTTPVIAAVIFGTMAIVGGVVGYMTTFQAKATALTIDEEIPTPPGSRPLRSKTSVR
ncbi:hypothetical protein DFJ73DRAFT_781712 [Zopfochytrium polystomum]|nr:hypothetical protein DFJ73DRAFT_781712 [Zopfochytrium polystomum]